MLKFKFYQDFSPPCHINICHIICKFAL